MSLTSKVVETVDPVLPFKTRVRFPCHSHMTSFTVEELPQQDDTPTRSSRYVRHCPECQHAFIVVRTLVYDEIYTSGQRMGHRVRCDRFRWWAPGERGAPIFDPTAADHKESFAAAVEAWKLILAANASHARAVNRESARAAAHKAAVKEHLNPVKALI